MLGLGGLGWVGYSGVGYEWCGLYPVEMGWCGWYGSTGLVYFIYPISY